MRAFAPSRIGPSMSSTDVNDDAHVGQRSTSVKTDHTTSIGASIVMDTRSIPSFPILHSCSLSQGVSSARMYQMVHRAHQRGQGRAFNKVTSQMRSPTCVTQYVTVKVGCSWMS
jgi:hypothetical protein